MIVLAQLFVPRLLRNRSRTATLALVLGCWSAIGFGAVGFAPNALALAGTVAIWTVGEMLSAPVSGTLTADLSPARSARALSGRGGDVVHRVRLLRAR